MHLVDTTIEDPCLRKRVPMRFKILMNPRLVGVVTSLLIFGCGGSSIDSDSYQVTLTQDANIFAGDAAPVMAQQGQPVLVKKEPTLIESPGYVSTLIVPIGAQTNDLRVAMKPTHMINAFARAGKNEASADRILSQIMPMLNEAQMSIAMGQRDAALEKMDAILVKYPKLHYVRFMKASVLALLKRNTEALSELELALSAFPENDRGQRFYESLTGRQYVARQRPNASQATTPDLPEGAVPGDEPQRTPAQAGPSDEAAPVESSVESEDLGGGPFMPDLNSDLPDSESTGDSSVGGEAQ